MVAVRCDQCVHASHAALHAFRNRLLTIVQMTEATDLSLLVKLVRHDFHPAHGSHIGKVLD
jgi:hypothetical protein